MRAIFSFLFSLVATVAFGQQQLFSADPATPPESRMSREFQWVQATVNGQVVYLPVWK